MSEFSYAENFTVSCCMEFGQPNLAERHLPKHSLQFGAWFK